MAVPLIPTACQRWKQPPCHLGEIWIRTFSHFTHCCTLLSSSSLPQHDQRAERMPLHKIWLVLPLHIGERQIMQVWNISEQWASPFLNQMLFPRCTVLTSDWWFVGRDDIWHHMVLKASGKVVEGCRGRDWNHKSAPPCPCQSMPGPLLTCLSLTICLYKCTSQKQNPFFNFSPIIQGREGWEDPGSW